MYEEEPQLRAIGYCRVACDDKNTEVKLKHQEELISQLAMMEDLELTGCYKEVGKAGDILQGLYEYCEEDGDIYYLLVSDFTRISRDVKEVKAWVGKFLELGVEVMWAEKSPIDSSISNRNKSFTEMYVPNLRQEA